MHRGTGMDAGLGNGVGVVARVGPGPRVGAKVGARAWSNDGQDLWTHALMHAENVLWQGQIHGCRHGCVV